MSGKDTNEGLGDQMKNDIIDIWIKTRAPSSKKLTVMQQKVIARDNWLRSVLRDSRLNSAAGKVATGLFLHYNLTTDKCFPSTSTLADELSMSRRQVTTAIKDLREAGWISSVSTGGGSNQYTFERMQAVDADESQSRPANDDGDGNHSSQGDENNRSHGMRNIVLIRGGKHESHKHRSDEHRKEHVSFAGAAAPSKRTPLPYDFELNDELRQIAVEAGISHENVNTKFKAFRAHAKSKDVQSASWSDQWMSYCLNGAQMEARHDAVQRQRMKAAGPKRAAI